MEIVVLERSVDPPLRIDDVRAMQAQASWCMEQHRIEHLTSLLSSEGQRLICFFVAPDAESVRSASRQVGAPFERVWTGTLHAPEHFAADAALAVAGCATVVVERAFAEPVELAAIQEQGNGGAWCHEQHRVRFLRTYFALDRRRMICIYAAPDAESVRSAQEKSAMPVEHLWAATVYDSHAS